MVDNLAFTLAVGREDLNIVNPSVISNTYVWSVG